MRKAILLFTVMALGLVLASGTALAALKIGTDSPDTLTGTSSADQITGNGGDDTLKGLAGNDVYYFDDGWGQDTLEEPATQRVKIKRKWKTVSGGSDTLSFSQTDTHVNVRLVRQWGPEWNSAQSFANSTLNSISLGTSVVENATGGRGSDLIFGGSDANTLQPGGGNNEQLVDLGGWKDGAHGRPGLPASNDTFKGFGSNTGTVRVEDWGGTADVVDLRPFGSSDVYANAVDFDGQGGTRESLQLVTGTNVQIIVVGHFGEYFDNTSKTGQQGRIEQLVFSDGTFGGEGTVGSSSSSVASASSEETSADSVEGLIAASEERSEKTSEGAELEKAAKKLLKEAQKDAPEDPLAQQQPSPGEGKS